MQLAKENEWTLENAMKEFEYFAPTDTERERAKNILIALYVNEMPEGIERDLILDEFAAIIRSCIRRRG